MISYLLIFFSVFSFAEFSTSGEVGFEFRHFKNDHLTQTKDFGTAVFTRVENAFEKDSYGYKVRGFARVDRKDKDRSLVVLEDAYGFKYFAQEESEWKLLAGYKVFNWTALEAFHPADKINSRNLDSDLEKLEKVGEMTIEASRSTENGSISFFYFPKTEDPYYPGDRNRLGFGVDIDRPIWVDGTDASKNKRWPLQYGARLNYTFWESDLSLHYLHHFDRDFPLIGTHNYSILFGTAIPNDTSRLTTPYYYLVDQFAGTFQKAMGSYILKLEGAYRTFEKDLQILTAVGESRPTDHTELALGLEYVHAHEQLGWDSNFFFETQTILDVGKEKRSRLSALQRDFFLGWRLALNDIMGSEFLLSYIKDLERSSEALYNFNYKRRLSDQWKFSTGLRIYDARPKGATAKGLEALHGDHHYYFNISCYF